MPVGLGLPVHTPPADTWQDWVEKFGIDPDRVRGMESEDLAWLRAGEGEGHFHGPGAWPFDINAYAGREDNDLILWLPSIGAIVTGDSLSDFGDGLDIQLGGRKHVTRECRPTASSAARPAGRARAARTRRADGSRGARARALVSGAARIRGSRDVAPSCASVLSLRFGGDSAAHGRDPAPLSAAQEYDAMIAAAAIMIALLVWAALSAVRLLVRGLLVLAFLPYYLRRR